MDDGDYSRPIPVPPGFGPDGFMVVQVQEKIESRPMEVDEVRRTLSDRLLQVEQDQVFGEWLKERMVEYQVEIYPDALGEIDFDELREQED